MSESTKRIIRTGYQVVVGIVTFFPIVLGLLPYDLSSNEKVVAAGVWIAFVAGLINKLEDAGVLPAWLKD